MSTFSTLSYPSQLPFIHPVKDIVASSDNKGIYGVLAFSNKVHASLHVAKNIDKYPAGVLPIDQEES